MKFKSLTIIFFFTLVNIGNAQEKDISSDHKDHEHHRNEIGIANSAVYFMKEKTFSYELHLHYVYTLKDPRFGLGIGYERIFDEHKHNAIGIAGSYSPLDKLYFSLSPGIVFEMNSDNNPGFALHFETSYEFEINDFHLGPVIDFAYEKEDIHLSAGIHLGFGF